MGLVCESPESYEPAGGNLEVGAEKKIQMKEKRRFSGCKGGCVFFSLQQGRWKN